MCGIAGLLEFTDRPPSMTVLEAMAERMAHRGPDGSGIHVSSPCGLAHARLAILDPDRGAQPMSSSDGAIWITHNGEIYNSPALRDQLAGKGCTFRTTTDTEVIIRLYERDPEHFVERLEGIFAFAIWDARRRQLILARDYIGVKPLYVYASDQVLVFGSEVKALLADARVPCEADRFGLMEILAFQNIYPPRTCFKDIRLLRGGEILTVRAGGASSSRQYWSFAPPGRPAERDMAQAAQRLRPLVEQIVTDQLLSDVPVASYLSGGMDTGAITSIAGRSLPSLHTFSGGFKMDDVPAEYRGFDERESAELMSRRFNTHHHFREITPYDLAEHFTSICWHLEEPRGSTCYAPWMMAREAGARVKVILSGHGGDELFAGYRGRYQVAESYGRDWEDSWFKALNYVIPRSTAAKCLHGDFVADGLLEWPRRAFDGFVSDSRGMSPLARAQHHDLFVYMHGLLLIEDKLSMAHSLESRVPLLDRRLFEFAWTLPDDWKLGPDLGKVVLREAMRGAVPEAILERDKMGFGPPDEHYYRHQLKELFDMLLLDGSLARRNIVNAKAVESFLHRQRSGEPLAGTLWTLASLELWHRTFIDRAGQLRQSHADAAPEPIELPTGRQERICAESANEGSAAGGSVA